MLKKIILTTTLLLCSSVSIAKDYGVQGNVWPITEIDIRQMLLESASRTDWDGVGQKAKDSGDRYLESLPNRQFPEPSKSNIKYIDPSLVITEDIMVPVKKDGGVIEWEVLAAKGTRVNPLEKVRPVTGFLLFDGNSEKQVEMLTKVLEIEPDRITPVEAGAGNVKDLAKEFQRPIFWANDAMLKRFEIETLPSFVFIGEGNTAKHITVASFASPFHAPSIVATWPTLAEIHQLLPKPESASK